jgi:hypothetical protein
MWRLKADRLKAVGLNRAMDTKFLQRCCRDPIPPAYAIYNFAFSIPHQRDPKF